MSAVNANVNANEGPKVAVVLFENRGPDEVYKVAVVVRPESELSADAAVVHAGEKYWLDHEAGFLDVDEYDRWEGANLARLANRVGSAVRHVGEYWGDIVAEAAAAAELVVPWAGSDPSLIRVSLQAHYGNQRWHDQSVEVLESAIFYKDNHLRLIHDGHEFVSFGPDMNVWRRRAGADEVHPDNVA